MVISEPKTIPIQPIKDVSILQMADTFNQEVQTSFDNKLIEKEVQTSD